ncbi:NAD(P)/FAD-dependent oxidoreductase [Pseudoponticoccus marisrubri]|uniref:N-acyl homoserine lactone synthase n=1 Tax=Pseudoponticoccus marisrubri TaxID=1685382 RepID=A0A0W7WF29_9RHOB|nr:FAD-dependent oxidoreductase [Pseudoponticoccus marisrubri]KUF09226.1 N-acyl homoserine lactone synthase [Pseudoponticoccus marisrubri]
MSKRIAIVGGGYLGAELARSLEDTAEVTLIEQRSHFVHTSAMIRAVVTPELLDDALIPYDKLLSRGRVLQARATALDAEGVTLADGSRVAADYVVAATGSSNALPFKAKGDDIAWLRAQNAEAHARLVAAKTVAIVGAGAVGTELAGEIAHFMPDKTVYLISDQPALFPDQPAALGRALTVKLRHMGVKLVLGARAEDLPETTAPFEGTLTLSDGTRIEADLVFPVLGATASSELLTNLPGAEVTGQGRIKVDDWLRPSPQLPNLFAAGDVAATGDGMTVVATARQGPWLTKTLKALCAGRRVEDLPRYTPWRKAPILIPLGPRRGSSFLVLKTVGDLLTRQMKGKDLFIGKYQRAFGRR